MIFFRPFRNTDPPRLAEIWRAQSGHRGLMQPMSAAVIEQFVLAKPYFERQGLIVADDGDRLLGFAHAGFGPNEDQSRLSRASGTTSLVMVRPDAEPALAGELLAHSEQYLRDRGAKQLFGGSRVPLAPFYYALYGGSEPAGVLNSDRQTQTLFEAHGYESAGRSLVLHRELSQFRPVVDRQQMQIRRHNTLQTVIDPPTATWWEACLYEPLDRTEFLLMPRNGVAPAARAYFWNMETMAPAWGVRATGIVGLEVWDQQRRQGLATFLLGEAIRQLHAQGVALAEVQVAADNDSALALFYKLGFSEVDQAVYYRKP